MNKSLINRIQDLHHIAVNLERALTQKHLQISGSFCHESEFKLFTKTYKKCLNEIEADGNRQRNYNIIKSPPSNSRD